MDKNTKENIKNRMVKNAAAMWNVPANEIETSFDPLITLLISACASEIEKIAGEINGSQTRITEKVLQLMTPESSSGPSLAHGILYSEPSDDVTLIKPEYLFSYRKEEIYNKTSIKYKEIYFSPVRNFNLVNAKVLHMATGNNFMSFDEKSIGQRDSTFLQNSKLNDSTLYLGISSKLKILPTNAISFYFELKGLGNEELFYHHLRNTQWFANDAKLTTVNGFTTDEANKLLTLENIFENVSDKSNTICRLTINKYKKQYITLLGENEKGIKESKFDELNATLDENGIKTEKSIRWIKIVFPTVISNALLKNVNCSLNAFPVLNRALNSFSYSIKEFINILPIKTDDLFYDIKYIGNTEGEEYTARNKDNSNMTKGTFVVRNDGIGKLDKRNAREYVIHLTELLKDESASFSFLDNDFLRSNLRILNQVIALLEKKVSEASSDMVQTTYVALKPYKAKENLLVEYWTTNGKEANNINSGTKLSVYKGFGVKQDAAYFLTTTHGGKDDQNTQDRINSSRRSLLSKERIVTKEDIKALCLELYGDKISQVEIRRNYQKHFDLNRGLVPCIEIVLTQSNQSITEVAEWDSIASNLRYYLEQKSINVLPYKIKIQNQNNHLNGQHQIKNETSILNN